jgi:hypothetical protein
MHSLFSGYSGMALAAGTLSRGGSRYRRLSDQLDVEVIGQVLAGVDDLGRQPMGVPVWSFDVISGLSGSGAYLLTRREHSRAADRAVTSCLEALVQLCSGNDDLPAWYTRVEFMEGPMAELYPFGNLNCGLAHGIPGVLAFLALAWRGGARVPGQERAIRGLSEWLSEYRSDDGWGPNWPVAVGISTGGLADITHSEPSRSAWCYGAPGVARALWLAARATGDLAAAELAIEAMRGVFRRPVPERLIDSPTFCHGVAGLLQITLRFHHDTGLTDFAEAAQELTGQLLEAYDKDRPAGFYSVEPGGTKVDQPGLLDGAAGVALTLLAAGGALEPSWDRLFLLS